MQTTAQSAVKEDGGFWTANKSVVQTMLFFTNPLVTVFVEEGSRHLHLNLRALCVLPKTLDMHMLSTDI
jgi:hypothetical protein